MPLEKPKKEAHKVWREEYLRLLTVGPTGETEETTRLEIDLMAELIKEEYAEGLVRKNEIGENTGIKWAGPTAKGRIFADDLYDYVEKKSKRYQLKIFETIR